MQDIITSHGKLLYIVYEMYQDKTINERDKWLLKDLIIDNDPKILGLIEKYFDNGTVLTLRNDVIQLMRTKRSQEPLSPECVSSSSSNRDRRRKLSVSLKVTIPEKNIQKIQGRGFTSS